VRAPYLCLTPSKCDGTGLRGNHTGDSVQLEWTCGLSRGILRPPSRPLEFSLLDGLSRISEMTQRLADQGMPALALTDHGSMYGVIPFYAAAHEGRPEPTKGMRPALRRRSDPWRYISSRTRWRGR